MFVKTALFIFLAEENFLNKASFKFKIKFYTQNLLNFLKKLKSNKNIKVKLNSNKKNK